MWMWSNISFWLDLCPISGLFKALPNSVIQCVLIRGLPLLMDKIKDTFIALMDAFRRVWLYSAQPQSPPSSRKENSGKSLLLMGFSVWGLPCQLLVSEGARGVIPVPGAAHPCSAQYLDAALTACVSELLGAGRINK